MMLDWEPSAVKSWRRVSNQFGVDMDSSFSLGHLGKAYRGFSFARNQLVGVKIVGRDGKAQLEALEDVENTRNNYVLGFYGYLEREDQLFIFIQYCPKGSLRQLLQQGLGQKEVLRLFRQLVEGMQYLDLKGVKHGDLLPGRILVGPENDIKICHCTLFRALVHDQPPTGEGEWETALYSAPELFLAEPGADTYSEKSAVWSAGLILTEMLTGEGLMDEVKDYEELKDWWLSHERGLRKVSLQAPYHPVWNAFANSMLVFSVGVRPSFRELHQTVKLLYREAAGQIAKGTAEWSPPTQKMANYLAFHRRKYQVLLDLCQVLASQDIRLRNEFKYLIMFCCLMRYLSFVKSFSLALARRRVRVGEQDLVDDPTLQHPFTALIIREAQTEMEQKVDFYQPQISNNIVPKIVNDYFRREESQGVLKELGPLVQLVRRAQRGQVPAMQQEYQESLQSVLGSIGARHGQVTEYFTLEELRIYHHILIAMLLSENFPVSRYDESQLIEEATTGIQAMKKEELLQHIQSLSSQIY